MNENLDLTEILKDCPKGTKLYSPALGECALEGVNDNNNYPIKVKYKIINNDTRVNYFTKYGYLLINKPDAECMLFPSKEQRDWNKWQRPFVKGDILVTEAGNIVLCSHIDEKQLVHYHRILNFLGTLKICNDIGVMYSYNCNLANDSQKQKLFDALKKEGYEWDAEKKELKTLQQFKDGDIVATNDGKYIAIIKNNGGKYYVCCHPNVNYFHIDRSGWFDRLATEEEKATLFQAIKDNGYKWNAETKILEKIKKEKFNPQTLQPFDKVLVSCNDEWFCDFFSHYDDAVNKFNCTCTGGCPYECCIPYNDDTKHLIGKSIEEAPEFYKYWEE